MYLLAPLAWFIPLLVIVFLIVLLNFIPVGLWISALAAGVRVGLVTLVGCESGEGRHRRERRQA